ncbi:NAD(P)/FAD-dependent oxidoreductase [Olleya aquimaris]|nr:NAD(P)/FAD-dependent oxidoreductase [Olleya aquimaris]
MKIYETLIIGGGQAGFSVAYFLRRYKIDYLILDDQDKAGGSWLQTWDSLKLFSPTQFSSLSGWAMPKGNKEYPSKMDFIRYMEQYQARYKFNIERQTKVLEVYKMDFGFKVKTKTGYYYCKTLVSATGTAQNPFIPKYTNKEQFSRIMLHSSNYKNADTFKNKSVLIVGGGNSGAQILAEVSKVANIQWVTMTEPSFLPDDIDGRYLFIDATDKFYGKLGKTKAGSKTSLIDIVMVQSVKEARSRDVLHAKRPFKAFYKNGVIWEDDTKTKFDVVIWCTGFKANLKHLQTLDIIENNKVETSYTQCKKLPNLWLVGYGSWTGFASATIYGVGKTARHTVNSIVSLLRT